MTHRAETRDWTEGEVARLRALAPDHSCDGVAFMLNRSPDSVRGKARALGDVSFNAKHGTSNLYGGTGWTEEREERLKTLWVEGLSAAQIVKDLGGVTRNAVIGKVHRLGLGGRAAPSRPAKRRVTLANPRAPQAPKLAAAPFVAAPPLEPLKREDGSTVSILTCDDTTCRFPIGDPRDDGFALCGRPACGRYCAAHEAMAFDRVRTNAMRSRRVNHARDIERQMRRHVQ